MKSLRIISLLLCLLLVLPMLFACKEKVEEAVPNEGTTTTEGQGIDLTIPDFKYYLDVTVTNKYDDMYNGTTTNTFNTGAYVCVSGSNFRIESSAEDMLYTLTLCDKVLYADFAGAKYKLDFNSIDIKTLATMALGVLLSSDNEVDDGDSFEEGDASLYSAAAKDAASALSGIGSSFFQSTSTQFDENGVEMTIYTGLQPKVAELIDSLIAEYVLGYGDELVIDYDNLKIGIGGTDSDAAFTLNLAGTFTEFHDDISETTEFEIALKTAGSIANIEPIVAPSDADIYENALPLLMSHLLG